MAVMSLARCSLVIFLVAVTAIPCSAMAEERSDPVAVLNYEHSVRPDDLTSQLNMAITFGNVSDKAVLSFKGEIVWLDLFGESLVRSPYTYGKTTLAPGASTTVRLSFEDNPFIPDEAFDRLAAFDADKLKVRLESVQVAVEEHPAPPPLDPTVARHRVQKEKGEAEASGKGKLAAFSLTTGRAVLEDGTAFTVAKGDVPTAGTWLAGATLSLSVDTVVNIDTGESVSRVAARGDTR